MSNGRVEPLVRIRCQSAEEASRCATILGQAGLAVESSLLWLVVRDADPDQVNAVLVAGGATSRVAAREQIGRLVAYLLDRQGDLDGRGQNLENLVGRVLSESGLAGRYRPADQALLLAAGRELHQALMATRGGFLSWPRFLELFCVTNRP